jgi:hypothetical protein
VPKEEKVAKMAKNARIGAGARDRAPVPGANVLAARPLTNMQMSSGIGTGDGEGLPPRSPPPHQGRSLLKQRQLGFAVAVLWNRCVHLMFANYAQLHRSTCLRSLSASRSGM